MDVRKTNGSFEEYDKAKLARGIHEAYKTAGEYCDDAIVVSIINNLYVYEGITSAEIRRQVEESLMSVNKRVALAYIEKFDADLDLRKKRDEYLGVLEEKEPEKEKTYSIVVSDSDEGVIRKIAKYAKERRCSVKEI